jgi:hypothetical protein
VSLPLCVATGQRDAQHADVKSPLVAALTSAAVLLAAPAHADPGYDSSPEDDAFIAAITGDGITMNRADAITEGHAVCMFLLSGSGSMMDAMIQAKQQHSWNMTEAAHFVDRSVQNYCPSRAPF